MANRRKFLAGLGALASGSAAAIGTGAFTSVSADRSVDVQVKGDGNAYLGLANSGGANDEYFDDSNDEYAVNFADSGNGGSGVNPNADTVALNVFQINNQGTQEVEVDLSSDATSLEVEDAGTIDSSFDPSDGKVHVALASDDDSDGTYTLGTGDTPIGVDFAINSNTSDFSDLTLTIEADA